MSGPPGRHLAELVADRQHDRLLRLSFPQGGEPAGADLVVDTLHASEGLSRDFEFTAGLLSSNAGLSLKDLQGKMLCVELVRPDGTLRHFTGIVFGFRLVRTDGNLAFYEARLGPWLQYLRLRANNRLFHRQTLRAQTEAIFNDYGVLPKWEWFVRGEDPPRTMAVQGGGAGGESDHNYLHRRWEAAGYSYWYEHSAEGHTLHVCDDSTLAKAVDGSSSGIRFQDEGGAEEEDAIGQWRAVRELVPAQTAVSAFDFKSPRPQHAEMPSNNQQGDVPQLEVHEYGGARHFKTSIEGEGVARRRIGEIEAKAKRFEAEGNNRFVLPGRWFRLIDHFGRTQGDGSESEFLILSVEHRATNNYLQEPGAGAEANRPKGTRAEYRNSFTCGRRFVAWMPGRGFHSVEQRVLAPQTATVVGPASEGSIHTDEFGRIRIQFHWDREGQNDEKSSAWVRVLSNWAGGETGMVSFPRVGSEVVVQCLDGNPDHPVVMGVVYNARRMPPWALPGQKALMGLRSRELAEGSGNEPGGKSNHLLLDDTPAKIQAQLRSDHDASQLSLGHIARIEDNAGRKDERGQGFELRTDGHGAIRAMAGLLISTEPRPNAQAHITDMGETVARLANAGDQQESLADLAQQHQAQDKGGDQDEVGKALKAQSEAVKGSGGNPQQGEFPELSEPHMVLASPAGIAATSVKSTHLHSEEHVALTSAQHMSFSVGKRLLASAIESVRIFAYKLGMKLVAANGDIDIQALKDNINLLAKLKITQTADEIVITAKQKVTIVGAGSYTHWSADGIRSGTSGAWVAHAASHSLIGPDTQPASFPAPPAPGNGTLELFNKYVADQRGVKGGDYEVVDALGTVKTGKLDANGFASVAGLFPGPASVTFGDDPSRTWEEGSYFGKPRNDAAGGADAAGAGGLGGAAQAAMGQIAGVLGKSGIAADAGGLASLAQTVQSGLQAARALQAVGKGDLAGLAGGAASLLGNPAGSLTGAAVQAAGSSVGKLLPPKLADAAANLLPRATTATGVQPEIAGLKIPGFVG